MGTFPHPDIGTPSAVKASLKGNDSDTHHNGVWWHTQLANERHKMEHTETGRYPGMTLEALAHKRNLALSDLKEINTAMKRTVIHEKQKGQNITQLARTSGVVRTTIYEWLSNPEL